jgi:hypothetical protein
MPPSETGGGSMRYSQTTATVPTPGQHALLACMSVIRNFQMGVGVQAKVSQEVGG